jgi:GT2 family glycosyltransferase
MRKPKVASIICNWNKKGFVLSCIKSVKESNYENLEIIVVDNASTDGSAEAIQKLYPDVTLIENPVNIGGAGGFNTGLQYCLDRGKYDYLHCLDNDVVIAPDAISNLVDAAESDQTIAFAGSKIMLMDEPHRVQELGAYIDWNKLRIRLNKSGRIDSRPPELKDTYVHYVPACSLMASTKVLKKIGIMDRSYFIYFDDIDWATRAIIAGYKVKAISSSKVWHKRGGTTKTSNLPAYYWCRNEGYFFNRYVPGNLWGRGMRKWLKTYFQAIAACEIYGKTNTSNLFKKAILDLSESRRGSADLSNYSTIERGNYMMPSDIFDGKRVFILRHAGSGTVHRMVKFLSSPSQLEYWNPGKTYDADILIIPVNHVLNGKTNHEFLGKEVFWVDGFSNILPSGLEGDNILKKAVEIKESFQGSFEAKILSGLSHLKATDSPIPDQKLQYLIKQSSIWRSV